MKKASILLLTGLWLVQCTSPVPDSPSTVEQFISPDLNQEPTFLNLKEGISVPTWDLKFSAGNQGYLVDLNEQAGTVVCPADSGVDFATAAFPGTISFQTDTMDQLAIGERWLLPTSYNPMDHSIQGRGQVYFLRCADYRRLKLEVLRATPTEFQFRWAEEQEDHTFLPEQAETVSCTADAPARWSPSLGSALSDVDWHLGLVSKPITVPNVGTFYMPSVQINTETVSRYALWEGGDLEGDLPAASTFTWQDFRGETQPLGYGGSQALLVYHPEPPYNHKVIVEHPEQILVLDLNPDLLLVQFLDYDSGVAVIQLRRP
ncbi:MAG: hypothetical protein D6762_08450 [Candidatus Neomarinimicrobiota bacterium]|nr:MAG: hypothetical protein D6762_08450 [Candidatus Neomarinimicrobiota bacterium]